MKLKTLSPRARLYSIAVQDGDWQRENPARLRWMAQLLVLVRRFEEAVLELKGKDLVHGPVHSSVGQEAVAVGAALALRPSDRIAGTHRAHHQYLAKVLCSLAPEGFDPLEAGLTAEMQEAARVLLSEIMGLADGCCGGRGGSMHLSNPAAGVLGTNAIVGGGIPVATGAAWADLRLARDAVTVCFFGDGALYQGTLHEAANLASLWNVPIVFCLENNQYAVGTSARAACSAERLCEVAAAYGLPGISADGMDPLAVMLAIREIIRRGAEPRSAAPETAASTARTGWLPCLLVLDTYRFYHHAGAVAGSSYGYRDGEEESRWRARDPIAHCGGELWRTGVLDEEAGAALRENAERCVAACVAACTENRGGTLVVPELLWPTRESLTDGLRIGRGASPTVEEEDMTLSREIRYVDSIALAQGRWLEKDERVVVLGEEVANFGGGAYGGTRGLPQAFPRQVINTPITEAGFCGLATGAALNGMHPIVEIMFSSFCLVAADQLLNQAGQLGYLYGGQPVPLVVRTRVATGMGYGAQHCLQPAALFDLFPGWRIVAPATPFDYIGLFNTAMSLESPTLILEHQGLYGAKGKVPDGPPDHRVAYGAARIVREGRDITVVAYSLSVQRAQEAAALLAADRIEAEVIDLRTLDSGGVDYETLGRSLARTGILAVVEEAPSRASLGPRIAAECERRFFDSFDGPPHLVAGPDVPMPVSRRLEAACIPTVEEIAKGIRLAALRQR